MGTVWPSLMAMLRILPAKGLGTETVALSVSISMIAWSFLMTSPTLTKISRTSPDSMPSPRDGSLISVGIVYSLGASGLKMFGGLHTPFLGG